MTKQISPASNVQQQISGSGTVAALLGAICLSLPTAPGAAASPFSAVKTVDSASGGTETGAARLRLAGMEDFKVGDVAGTSSAPVPLSIQLPDNAVGAYSFLMLRNMPPGFTLSAGFGAKDYWAVSLKDINGLRINAPGGYEGSFTLEVLLVKGKGADPERRTAKVELQSSVSAPAVASTSDDNKLLTATRPDEFTGTLPLLDPPRQKGTQGGKITEFERSMMERGDALLKNGDITPARLLYSQVAKKGIAEGAFAMGNTYAPDFLATLPVRGLTPDIALARSWYRRAEELGSEQAARRLSALSGQRD